MTERQLTALMYRIRLPGLLRDTRFQEWHGGRDVLSVLVVDAGLPEVEPFGGAPVWRVIVAVTGNRKPVPTAKWRHMQSKQAEWFVTDALAGVGVADGGLLVSDGELARTYRRPLSSVELELIGPALDVRCEVCRAPSADPRSKCQDCINSAWAEHTAWMPGFKDRLAMLDRGAA